MKLDKDGHCCLRGMKWLISGSAGLVFGLCAPKWQEKYRFEAGLDCFLSWFHGCFCFAVRERLEIKPTQVNLASSEPGGPAREASHLLWAARSLSVLIQLGQGSGQSPPRPSSSLLGSAGRGLVSCHCQSQEQCPPGGISGWVTLFTVVTLPLLRWGVLSTEQMLLSIRFGEDTGQVKWPTKEANTEAALYAPRD